MKPKRYFEFEVFLQFLDLQTDVKIPDSAGTGNIFLGCMKSSGFSSFKTVAGAELHSGVPPTVRNTSMTQN